MNPSGAASPISDGEQHTERSDSLERWSRAFPAVAAEYRALVAQGRWVRGPADTFGILGLSRSELHHSAMLAWLLDPTARHGLGDELIRRVLARWWPEVTDGAVRVRRIRREVARFETRADIVVWGDGWTLVIENKVDAAEGTRQCDRLYERFGSEPGVLFMFLTPDGSPPRTATGRAADVFVAASWAQMRELLAEAVAATDGRPAQARSIALDYLRTLEGQFG